VDLIYIDPPYGTGKKRTSTRKTEAPPTEVDGFEDRPASDPRTLTHLYSAFVLSRELLSPTGQMFVHVDHRAGHFVRQMMDEVFGANRLRNEIFWHYESGGRARKTYARKADVILWYSRSNTYTFRPERIGRPRNQCWKCGSELEKWNHMKRHTDKNGRTYRTIKSAGRTYRYYDDEPVPPSNVWLDIPHIHQKDPQRTGYPAQKPEALLNRIIAAHSDPGDVVCDFFCGCGTTLAAAHKAGRRWIGCDANPLAIHLTRKRLLAQPDRSGPSFSMERLVDESGSTPARPRKPDTVAVRLEKNRDTVSVRLRDPSDRARLDFWAVQWHPSADTVFRPQWWSIGMDGAPVAAQSSAMDLASGASAFARVLTVDRQGVEEMMDLE
jgi:site-specific DNA-methyltransferase (adenine-specific)/adenine-specific DNA-methyltransferase